MFRNELKWTDFKNEFGHSRPEGGVGNKYRQLNEVRETAIINLLAGPAG